MRKVFLWAILLAFLSSGCAPATETGQGGKLAVVGTVFPLYDFARVVGGERVSASMLLKPGVDSHSFEPSPQDLLKIQSADVFLCIGGVDEAWVNRVFGSMQQPPRVLRLIELEGEAEGQDDHDEHGHSDEHIWLDPGIAAKMAQAIGGAFAEADPRHATDYRAAADAYQGRLNELSERFQALVDGAKRKEIVVGDRFPFAHFTEAFGIEAYSAFAGCGDEGEPSAQVLAQLIERVRTDRLPVVYKTEQSDGRIARAIASPAGAEVLELHSCHNVSPDEQGTATYLSLMEGNLRALQVGLN